MQEIVRSLSAEQIQIEALLNLVSILEKTNEQLSLWWNPYGIMIASLGVLFTILAGVFTFLLWRQSSEYKSIFDNFLKKQKEIFDLEIQRVVSEGKTNIDELIAEKTKNLESLTDEKLREAENEIIKLKEKRESLTFVPVTVSGALTTAMASTLGGYAVPGGPIGISRGFGIIGEVPQFNKISSVFTSCGSCGQYATTDGAKFCSNCGHSLT